MKGAWGLLLLCLTVIVTFHFTSPLKDTEIRIAVEKD
jgi:hypothetical protein